MWTKLGLLRNTLGSWQGGSGGEIGVGVGVGDLGMESRAQTRSNLLLKHLVSPRIGGIIINSWDSNYIKTLCEELRRAPLDVTANGSCHKVLW